MMCLIVDTNIAAHVFVHQTPDFAPVVRAIASHRHRVFYGGQLFVELKKNAEVLKRLLTLDRAGAAHRVPDAQVAAAEQRIIREGQCVSNDTHVIALAVVSKSRLLCSLDHDLSRDFRSVLRPPGRVYRGLNERHMVQNSCRVCRPRRQRRRG